MSEDLINLDGGSTSPASEPVGEPQTVAQKETAAKEGAPGSWLSKLSDESLRSNKTLARFANEEEAVKAYVELRGQMGKNIFPDGDTSEEQLQEFYRKAGIPDPSAYKVDVDKYGLSAEDAAALKELASKNGIPERGLSQVFDLIMDAEKRETEAQRAEMTSKLQEQVAALKEEYGDTFGKYSKLAGQVAQETFSEVEIETLKKEGFFSNPMVAKILMNQAKEKYGEQLIKDEHTKQGLAVSKEAAEAKVQEILGDPDYMNGSSPRHRGLVEQMKNLQMVLSAG